tara:strand:+ start:22 stop:366 length:345 start_codon:yes stop_codon:yes gene_type:complete
MEKKLIEWSDFEKIDIRVGTVIHSEINENTLKRSFIIHVDFGPLGIKKTSAQITGLYKHEELLDKQVIGILNFPKKQIANMKSEFLLLGSTNEQNNDVVILEPERKVSNGSKVK